MVLQLYPPNSTPLPLEGLYLNENLHQKAKPNKPFIYANFISSVDGRISMADESGKMGMPHPIENGNDWRLFQELVAQADILFVGSNHLHTVANDPDYYNAQFQLPQYRDLAEWRAQNGFPPFPDTGVISQRLDFPVPPTILENGRKLLVFTSKSADPVRVAKLQDAGADVILCGDETFDATCVPPTLAQYGHRTAYISFGPNGLHSFFKAGIIDHLYLSLAHRLVGGNAYWSLVEGTALDPAANLKLTAVYLDETPFDGHGQLFLSYAVGNETAVK